MAGVTITFHSQALQRALDNVRRRGQRGLSGVGREIGEHMVRSIRANFEAQGRPTRWAPLSSKTLLGRAGGKRRATTKKGTLRVAAARRMAGAKILIQSARLMNSITYVVEPTSVVVGTNTIYAGTHQFGRRSGRGAPIPARPFLVVQAEDEHAIAQMIERHLAGAFA